MITRCNLIVSTTHNNDAMNHAVKWVADHVISRKGTITDSMLNQVEVAIRAYDPCLSCATQALGKMPLKAELYDHSGKLIDEDTKNKSKHLIIGIGNSARADDALGWAFVSHVSQIMGDVFDYELRYQLQVEDSELICNYESILFVDATKEPLQDGFEMKRCEIAQSTITFHPMPKILKLWFIWLPPCTMQILRHLCWPLAVKNGI